MTVAQVHEMRKALLTIAARLRECETVDFGQGSVVDFEMAETPQQVLDRTLKFAGLVDKVLTGRDTMLTSKVTAAINGVQKAIATFITNLQLGGLRFNPEVVEPLVACPQCAERTTSQFAEDDLRALELGLMKCSFEAKSVVLAHTTTLTEPLEDCLADCIAVTQQSIPKMVAACRSLMQAACRREEDQSPSPDLDGLAACQTTTSDQIMAGGKVAVAAVEAVTLLLEDTRDGVCGTVTDLRDALADLTEREADLRKQIEAYQAAPRSDDDGDDAGDEMSFFERKAVEERDRLAAELDAIREAARAHEMMSRDRKAETAELAVQLDFARREMRAASDENQERLKRLEGELIAKLIAATIAAEAAERVEIEDAHHVAFMPVAQAFAVAFINVAAPLRADVETATDPVVAVDVEVSTTPPALCHAAEAQATPVVTDAETACVRPAPGREPVG